jgi:imidazolonepropionase-like amidohydrolase
VPAGARRIDGKGALALPGFIDAYSFAGCANPAPEAVRDLAPKTNVDVLTDMRDANRKGVLPSFRAADSFQSDAETDERYRQSGFGAWLAAPHGQLLSGTSALVTSREAAPRERIHAAIVFDHAGFDATGPGYPGTLMGSMAQLRQLFLDARWVQDLERRAAEGRPGRRPPHDVDLVAIRPVLEKERKLLCEAESANAIDRWLGLSDELGLDVAISGGVEAWRRAPTLAKRGVPVILTLQWGEEADDPHAKDKAKKDEPPKKTETGEKDETKEAETKQPEKQDPKAPPATGESASQEKQPEPSADDEKRWIYEEPLRVREEKRRLWEEKRDSALRLHEAGVAFAFGSAKDAPKDLLDKLRKLVEQGLPKDVALRALTSGAAELLGVGRTLGKLEPGRDATLALWDKDPLVEKGAHVIWMVVDGFAEEFEVDTKKLEGKPAEGIDATGAWTLTFDDAAVKPATGELTMQPDGAVEGTFRFTSQVSGTESEGKFEGQVAGTKLRVEGRVKQGNFEPEVVIEGEIDGAAMKGSVTWKRRSGERVNTFRAERKPKSARVDEGAERDGHDAHEPHDHRNESAREAGEAGARRDRGMEGGV